MDFTFLESEQGKPFKVKGIAMIKNSLSKNGRFYSAALVEKTVDSVKAIIENRGSYPLSMMADHPGITANKTLSTVGRITAMYLDGDNAIIEAEIANTTVGKDVQELIRGKFVEGLSIRASKGKLQKKYIGDKLVNDVMEMELNGVDLVVNPGVEGARVLDIIESDETNSGLFVSIDEEIQVEDKPAKIEEEEQLDWTKLNLEDIKANRPDLVESFKQEFKPVFEAEVNLNELQESVNDLKTEKADAEQKLQESEGKVSELEGKLEEAEGKLSAIEEAKIEAEKAQAAAELKAHVESKIAELKFAESVKAELKKEVEVLESAEEVDKVLESRVAFLEMVIKESTGVDVSGQGHTGENNTNVNEDEDFIKQVMES